MKSKTQEIHQLVAKIMLVLVLLNIVAQLAALYQTRYQLVSPLIPESIIWSINKQFVFHAFVSAITGLVSIILYFFKKYLFVIILVTLALIADRFVLI